MDADIFEEIQRLRRAGRKAVLATIVQIRGSVPSFQTAKMLVRDDGSTLGSVGGGCVEADVWAAAQDVIREEKSRVMQGIFPRRFQRSPSSRDSAQRSWTIAPCTRIRSAFLKRKQSIPPASKNRLKRLRQQRTLTW